MARFGSAGTQYFDNNGDPLSGGQIFIYETGTTTDKATYSDSALTTANTQPVVLDTAGRQPDIFFDGLANVVIKDSAGVQIDAADPVGEASTDSGVSDWSTSATYDLNDLVKASNSKYYISISGSNTGNEPSTSTTNWVELTWITKYNANYTYGLKDITESGDILYISLASSNIGNTPVSSPTKWKPLSRGLVFENAVQTTNFTAEVGKRYACNTSGGAFTMTLPASPVRGDQVGFYDYGMSFDTPNLTIDGNGEDIMNDATDLVVNVKYFSGELEYVNTARGWILI